ncbi:MAG: tetratricopeptide repeat protein [Verrucomicrobia bacterium]|nr:tetratricopeptide repeat protein [Verrucomicrobiota bacterium]
MRAVRAGALAAAVVVAFLVQTAAATWVYSSDTGRLSRLESMPKENSLAQFRYAEQFEAKGQFDQALREYRKVVRYFPDSILAAKAQFKVGECYEKLGRYVKAFNQYQLVLEKYPSYSDPDEVIARQYAIANAFYSGRKKAMPLLRMRVLSGRSEAVRCYEQIALNAPFGPVAEEAKYRAGELLERKARYDDYTTMDSGVRQGAVNTYLFVVDNFDHGARRGDSLFRVGECYYKKAQRARHDKKAFEQALFYYGRYLREHPTGEHAKAAEARIAEVDYRRAESTFQVATYYEKRGKYRAALIYYQDLAARFPLSPYADQAEAKVAEMQKRLDIEPASDEPTEDQDASSGVTEPE